MSLLAVLLVACDIAPPPGGDAPEPPEPPASEPGTASEEPSQEPSELSSDTLRAVAEDAGIEIGTAVASGPLADEADYAEVVAREFSSVTGENSMKTRFVQPQRGQFDFTQGDALVEFAQRNGQVVRGHTLLWHNSNPDWLQNGNFAEDELREILREHITEVVSHYRGKIVHWDVINEVLDDNAELRESVWSPLGEQYIADAFRWAHEADPDAKLYLNDYNIEGINSKSNAYYELVQRLLADGVPIHGIGLQTHVTNGTYPSRMQENIQRFADLGLEVAITEADVRIEMPADDAELQTQADTYRRTLEACLAVPECVSYTVWGFTDRHSWVPGTFSNMGAATLMTEDLTPKPAYEAVRAALEAGR